MSKETFEALKAVEAMLERGRQIYLKK